MANTVGTKKRVATVANSRPPMTARPSGAFCSPPSPSPIAIGTIPIIIASAVMITGLNLVEPASRAARKAFLVSLKRSFAKLMIRTLFAVATPMLIMVPMSAGTLSVVCVKNNIQEIPASAAGRAVMIMKASLYDWKLITIRR